MLISGLHMRVPYFAVATKDKGKKMWNPTQIVE
jgi:hypothetical protein